MSSFLFTLKIFTLHPLFRLGLGKRGQFIVRIPLDKESFHPLNMKLDSICGKSLLIQLFRKLVLSLM